MLIATVSLWALVGVAGVAMAAALILRSATRLLPERRGSASWFAWFVICGGAVVGHRRTSRGMAGCGRNGKTNRNDGDNHIPPIRRQDRRPLG